MSSQLSVYDQRVSELTAMGFSREKAEAAVRVQLRLAPVVDPHVARADLVLEKTEQVEVRKRFVVCGFTVYTLSQPRPTKQTPGIPDLWLMNAVRGIALYWESKRLVGGRFSPAQLEFAAGCRSCGIGYGAGDRYEAQRWLVDRGLAEIVDGSFYPTRSTL